MFSIRYVKWIIFTFINITVKYKQETVANRIIICYVIYVNMPNFNVVYILYNSRLVILNNVKPNSIPLRTMTTMLHIACFSS
jgi:hypothetical protein